MLEHPGLAPVALRLPHSRIAHDAAEHGEHQWGFGVGGEAVVLRARVVRVPHHGGFGFVATGAAVALPLSVEHGWCFAAVGGREDVHVLVEAFVHPAVPGLVVGDRHGPPLVASFVVGGALVGVDDHGVLHAGAGAVLERHLRELVGEPEPRVELERVAGDGARVGEDRRVAGEEKHVHGDRCLPRDCGTSGGPVELLGGGPGKVVDGVRNKVPDQAISSGSRLAGADFIGPDDGADLVALEHVGQPLAGGGGQHLLGILQQPGAAHDPAGGHIDADVELSEVIVKLRGAEVELWVPSAEVVVDGDAWIPLCRLVERVGPALDHAVVGAGAAGDLVAPLNFQCGASLGGDRVYQRDGGAAGVHAARTIFGRCCRSAAATSAATAAGWGREVHGLAIDRHLRNHEAVGVLTRHPGREMRALEEEEILVEPHHDARERVGGVVADHDRFAPSDARGGRIELGVDGVVGA